MRTKQISNHLNLILGQLLYMPFTAFGIDPRLRVDMSFRLESINRFVQSTESINRAYLCSYGEESGREDQQR